MRVMRGAVALFFMSLCAAFGAPAGSLYVNANPGTTYGDRTITNIVWGDGYPAIAMEFRTDSNITFTVPYTGHAQRIANNGLTPWTKDNDNPAFIASHTNIFRTNAFIADTGTVAATYVFTSPMTLVDLIVCDVDDEDRAVISAKDADGNPFAPSNFIFVADGDLSLTNNAGGRDPLELATPPTWNPEAGSLTANVQWNENRTFTILRVPEGRAVSSITVTFTGKRHDNDGQSGNGLGSHIYVGLWATPRGLRWGEGPTPNLPAWSVPTLPGLTNRIEQSADLETWSDAGAVTGPPPPVAHVIWTNSNAAPAQFFRLAP